MNGASEILALAGWLAFAAGALAAVAEALHARRCRRLGRLAFGPENRPRAWTRLTPPLRVLALAGVAWALVTLIAFHGGSRARERAAAATRHLLVLLDVSPSMELKDAGDGGSQTRRERAAAVLKSALARTPGDQVRITMGCFYSDAMLLVKECVDRELIWNFADNLPLHMAFRPGKTDLIKSVNTGAEFVKDLPRKSTTALILTDGDTLPDAGLKPLPSAVAECVVVGLGDATRGMFIDGHLSRQDTATLSQLARRLGGQFHDGNRRQVPSDMLRRLSATDERSDRFQFNLRAVAIVVLAASAAILCLLPLLLEQFGSRWKPMRRRPAAISTGSGEMRRVVA